ncbi:MAG: glycosyl hydrolase family 18 protein [Defluviitaleaceae bacterium]|nr:glycosyl hydrolase family 18 protein [Defluviitaleaceae bacterium]
MTKRQIQWAITIFIGTIIIIGGIGLLIWQAFLPHLQQLPWGRNNRIVNWYEHHGLDPDIPSLVMDDRLRPHTDAPQPFIEDEVIFLPMSFLQYQFDPFIFWDDNARVLFVTTSEDILTFSLNQTRFEINGSSQTLEHAIRRVGDEIFFPASLAEALYPLTAVHYPDYNIIVVENLAQPRITARLTRRADIRYRENSNSPIALRAVSGSTVVVFEENGDFTRVRAVDGRVGWVLTSDIGETTTVNPLAELERAFLLGSPINNRVHPTPNWPSGTPVVMAWDSIYTHAANAHRMADPIDPSINVLSPMWFRLDEETMNITSVASREYVEWAHENGVQVWPYVFDVFYSHSHAILTDREARQRVIDTLLEYVDEFNLDGINIGFEHIRVADGVYLIQFLRELAPPLRERGVVLSKNVLVPRPYTQFYRRDLMAFTVDFIAVMAYDEHWHRAPTSGPVASIGFVERGIVDSLEQVPANQLILGLPFYNRVWREVIGNNTVDTRTRRYHGTAYTRAWFEYNGVEWEWLPETGKYYGEFAALEDDETVLFRVWLEDERSMELKLQLFSGYGLAGVSVWNRNFRHNEGLWEVMGQFFVE